MVWPSLQRLRAALHGLAVGLEVDAPGLARDQPRCVVAQGLIAVDVEHGRLLAVIGHEQPRVELDLALLQIPVGPHRQVALERAVGLADVDPSRQAEQRPDGGDPRADRDHDVFGVDRPVARVDGGDRARVVEVEPGDFDAGADLGAGLLRLGGEAFHRLAVEREPAGVLVQADRSGRARASRGTASACEPRPPPRRRTAPTGTRSAAGARGPRSDRSPAPEARVRRSRCRDSGARPGPRPTPRRTPPSARTSPAGSSCCGSHRRRSRTRRRRRSSCPRPARAGPASRDARRSIGRGRRRR